MVNSSRRIKLLVIVVTLCTAVLASSAPAKISDFQIKYFKVISKKAKMHPIDIGIDSSKSLYLGAFGDMNGDKKNDILMIDEDRQSLIAYLFNEQQSAFIKDIEIPVMKDSGTYINDVFMLDLN